jgi:hypothetical protein
MSLAKDLATLAAAVDALPERQCDAPDCVVCPRQVAEKQAAREALQRVHELAATAAAIGAVAQEPGVA